MQTTDGASTVLFHEVEDDQDQLDDDGERSTGFGAGHQTELRLRDTKGDRRA